MFEGSLVALITPFSHGLIDEPALRSLVDFHIENATDGIVACGTTGEAATLTTEEWSRVVEIVVDQTDGRIPVIAGTGSNDTAGTVARTRHARDLGVQAALIVTPYYNRPTQEGLYAHFATVAEHVDLPIVLYNVPGRTGVNLLPETVIRLAELSSIVAIKEASGSLDQASRILLEADTNLVVLSGDDSLTLPMMSMGARGTISVVANIAPALVTHMTRAALAGDYQAARAFHLEVVGLAHAMFIETNPAPVKAAAAWLGLCSSDLRLPLTPLVEANQRAVLAALRRCPYTEALLTSQASEDGLFGPSATSGANRSLFQAQIA